MRIKMYGSTNIGRKRKQNQDCLFYDETQRLGIVADGIGGRTGGEIASAMIVDGLRQAVVDSDKIRHEEINTFLASTIEKVNNNIVKRGKEEGWTSGMGTTLNCLMSVGDKMHIAHIGDSRTYLFYKGNFWQLTIDHNIETFVRRGWLPKTALADGVKAGALVRSIGLAETCDVDIYEMALKAGEIFVTCSDGLSGMVTDRRIAQIIYENVNRQSMLPDILIEEANKNGGKDNITVLISSVEAA